jgi:hypothetical protein
MSLLLLALALATPAPTAAETDGSSEPLTCSVHVYARDGEGHTRASRRVSASEAPAVVFRGRVSLKKADAPPLVFDVFNPRGQRHQILLATPRTVTAERGGQRVERTTRTREAAMAVGGSSIAWTSMYGTWRVEPRIEGTQKPCGKAQFFTIQP